MKGRKRKQPPPDFAKKKRKVGKGKPEPANATKVSFKAKNVVVPSQLEKSTKDDQPASHRNLSLQVRNQLCVPLAKYLLLLRIQAVQRGVRC